MLSCLFNTFKPAQLSSDGPVLFTFARLLPSRTKNSQDNEVRSLLIGAPSQTRWPRVLPILEALLKRTCLDAIDHWFSSHYITYIFHRACVCNPTVNFPNLCIDEGRIWDCVYLLVWDLLQFSGFCWNTCFLCATQKPGRFTWEKNPREMSLVILWDAGYFSVVCATAILKSNTRTTCHSWK